MTVTLDFKVERDRFDNLQAQTRTPLGFDRRELHITTHRNPLTRALHTTAQVVQMHADGSGHSRAVGLRPGCGDFRRTLAISSTRATEKAIRQQHGAALVLADALLAEARAYYAPAGVGSPAGQDHPGAAEPTTPPGLGGLRPIAVDTGA